jgi:uncharacterized protein (DUF58 family)
MQNLCDRPSEFPSPIDGDYVNLRRWIWIIVAIFLVGFVLRSGLLAYSFYVLGAILLISRFFARVWIDEVRGKRTIASTEAEVGDVLEVVISLHNRGKYTVGWLLVEDVLPTAALTSRPPRLKVQGKQVQVRRLVPGQKVKLTYEIECLARGYYQIGPLIFESGDYFGLHRRYRVAAEPVYLLVLPKITPLVGYDLASRRPIGDVLLTHRLYEDPTRIAGVRHYEPGDPLNRVHWRATARTGSLQSKVFEPSSLTGATIALDMHQGGYDQRMEPARSDLGVAAALALAHGVCMLGQQFGFATNGCDAAERVRFEGWQRDYRSRLEAKKSVSMKEKAETLAPIVIPSGRGMEHFRQIHQLLARVEKYDGLFFHQLLLDVSGRLPRDATLVAIVPDVTVETAVALGTLRRRGMALTAIVLCVDSHVMERCYARLLAEGVNDVRHLRDEAGISELCSQNLHNSLGEYSPFEDPTKVPKISAPASVYSFGSQDLTKNG